MFTSYLTTSLYSFLKNKFAYILNWIGLAIAIAAFFLVFLFLKGEFEYDRDHIYSDRTFRINYEYLAFDGFDGAKFASAPPLLASYLKTEFPQVKHAVRLLNSNYAVHYENIRYLEHGLAFVDSEFTSIFNFDLLNGSFKNSLIDPYSVVLTKSAAIKYFGKTNVIGKTLTIANSYDVQIKAVIENVKSKNHFAFDMLFPMALLEQLAGDDYMRDWNAPNFHTYIVTHERNQYSEMETEFEMFLDKMLYQNASKYIRLHVQKLTDIHLNSHLTNEMQINGTMSDIYMFILIALVIMASAVINYINLSISLAVNRAKEIGIRKSLGANRNQIFWQFIIESIATSLFALLIAFALVIYVLPIFNHYVGRSIQFSPFSEPLFSLAMLIFTVILGFLAGLYPALYISAYEPGRVLKGEVSRGSAGTTLRKVLLASQFVFSITLICSSVVVLEQVNFVKNYDLGYDKSDVIALYGVATPDARQVFSPLLKELRHKENVVDVTAASRIFNGVAMDSAFIETSTGKPLVIPAIKVYPNFLSFFGLVTDAGREFDKNRELDFFFRNGKRQPDASVMLNHAAAKKLGVSPEGIVGSNLTVTYGSGDTANSAKVIGVFNNFHHKTLYDPIDPFLFIPADNGFGLMFVKAHSGKIDLALEEVKSVWNKFLPSQPFNYKLYTEHVDASYNEDSNKRDILIFFSFLAVFITVIGLISFVSHSMTQRRKECSIRRICGATLLDLKVMFYKEFSIILVIANLFSISIAVFVMGDWLTNFVYRISLNYVGFLSIAAVSFLLTFAIIFLNVMRVLNEYPAKVLKSE